MKENYFDSDLEPAASPLPELRPEPEEEVSETLAKDENPKRKRQFMGYDLSTLLIAGGVLVALLVYAVWPDEPPQRAFVPDHQAAPVEAPAEEEAPAAEPLPVPAPAPEPTQHTEPVQPAAPPVDAQALQQASEANQQGISVLDGRVTDAERRLAELEARMKAMGTGTTAPAKAASKPVKRTVVKSTSASTHRTAAARTGTGNQRSTGVQGWRVHTIYPGMAWITHGGYTWSVQAGDNINGMTIRSINATARTVTTDRGVIRQGG
ncbi:hypothetical protein BL250_00515 [Erwinia sp. OLTSP20]|uniref:hypothetical protein n=1 Tax=unclassified Erwinia TaxID=2622719 RepID=UPI000C57AF2C|nr:MULTISPECIES: hypothetical protein [unclassified Erwinia]PIJ52159.1 hypothetical protein BV501_00955 [Erwinia sp. OAMSP11]PIJ73120.1 hypothetical protein BK416_07620 [Erwinia sp. OLSSP12]PIJ84689.1 hypothetical protein BLD47_01775 [Erwinia sp. OLCASP19]PIJ87336.1 hypothetical protein BLD46_00920 [Erwinia sp. OLMTSP26]PIJ87509.1 hypothetical protein BLD49_05755 [Erwinia sp. OLMDSP33]